MPDGYTVLVVPPSLVINPALYGKVPYDPHKHFDPVTVAVTTMGVLAVHSSLPVHTVKDLVAFIKSNRGKHTFASPGTGTVSHLVGEHFRLSNDLDLVHVPFNSAGPALGSTVAGHTTVAFIGVPPAVPQIREGKLRALAVTSNARSHALPEFPQWRKPGIRTSRPMHGSPSSCRRGRPKRLSHCLIDLLSRFWRSRISSIEWQRLASNWSHPLPKSVVPNSAQMA